MKISIDGNSPNFNPKAWEWNLMDKDTGKLIDFVVEADDEKGEYKQVRFKEDSREMEWYYFGGKWKPSTDIKCGNIKLIPPHSEK